MIYLNRARVVIDRYSIVVGLYDSILLNLIVLDNCFDDKIDFDRSELEALVNEAWNDDAELRNNQHFRFLELLEELMPVDHPER